MTTPSDAHNEAVGALVRAIVMPDGHPADPVDTLVLLESVIAGVVMVTTKPGNHSRADHRIVQALANHTLDRLAQFRAAMKGRMN